MVVNLSTTVVANKVEHALRNSRHTRRELAKYLGISSPTLRKALKGERPFTIRELEKIAAWLNQPLRSFLPTNSNRSMPKPTRGVK